MELLELLKQYAKMIEADSFDIQYNYKDHGKFFHLRDIDVYFWVHSGETKHHSKFETEEKAIEGLKGLIQFKQNAA